MEHWQFLIQKQGDRTWHSLESPNLKISAGRYRVLARSHLANTDVEVRVTHSSIQEVPPKRRILKRLRRTNGEGLMAVIPFTFLQPGIWELRCSGDLMSDLLGKSWQYRVVLQVLPPKSDSHLEKSSTSDQLNLPDYLHHISSTDSKVTILDSLSTELTSDITQKSEDIHEPPVSPVWLKGDSVEQILQNLIDLSLPTAEALPLVEQPADVSITPISLPLQLTLNRETYIAHWGDILTINGQVDIPKPQNLEDEVSFTNNLGLLQLAITLRSPLDSKILTQVRQPLSDQTLPLTFSTSIDIPIEDGSNLILAEISLYGAFANISEVRLLASQFFTITADIAQLLSITTATKTNTPDVSNQNTVPKTLPSDTVETKTSVNLGLELFNLVKTSQKIQFQPLIPVANQPLPPQIHPRILVSNLDDSTDEPWPQLPKLPINPNESQHHAVVTESPTIKESVDQNLTIPAINMEQLLIKPRRSVVNSAFPYLRRVISSSNDQRKAHTHGLKLFEVSLPITNEKKNTAELVTSEAVSSNESVVPEISPVAPELNESVVPEIPPVASELNESVVPEIPPVASELNESVVPEIPPVPTKLIIPPQPPSPLLRRWMQSQGYSSNESTDPDDENADNYIPIPEPLLATSTDITIVDVDLSLNVHQEIPIDDTTINVDLSLQLDQEIGTEATVIKVDLPFNLNQEITSQDSIRENVLPEFLEPLNEIRQIPSINLLKTPVARLNQEIVVDDIHITPTDIDEQNQSKKEPEALLRDLSRRLPINLTKIGSLPVPQLYVPEGELVAGTFVKIRVELPEVSPEVVVKLWLKDYQTRSLVDGPHLLANFIPKSLGGLEVLTELSVPFGCLEIRLEAIALDLSTQQESHKVTIVRTVIPPDLPNLELDELMEL